MTRQIIFYTDNRLRDDIASRVQRNLKKISQDKNIPIICVSLQPMDFGDINIVLPLERGIFTLFRQQLAGVEVATADVLFFCEHDVLYHPSHFDFEPTQNDAYFYNVNVWKINLGNENRSFSHTIIPYGHALSVEVCMQSSGLCGDRNLLLTHYKKRIEIVEQRRRDILARGEELVREGISKYMGFEPGRHSYPRGVDNYPALTWTSQYPNIDIRHDNNLTRTKWRKEDYNTFLAVKKGAELDDSSIKGWTIQDNIPGWGTLNHFWKKI